MKRVLITCVGSGVGQSVVDSLKFAKDRYFLVGSDQSRFVYSMPDCDAYVALPSIFAPDYLDALLAACAEYDIKIVIPGHDHELALFARNQARFDAAGVIPLVSDAALVDLLRDKLAWARAFCVHSDRVVASYSAAELRAGTTISYPAIAKPSGGSASAGLRILHTAADLDGVPEDYVVQPFLFPTDDDPEIGPIRKAVAAGHVAQLSEISVQLVYSVGSQILGCFASRNKLKGGVPIEVQPLDSAAVGDAVGEIERVLTSYRPRGPINLQGRMTNNGLVFFEMNPRFTGITGNRSQFGFNEVALLVDNFVDGDTRPLHANLRKVGVRQVACRTWPARRFGFEGAGLGARAVIITGGTGWLARQIASSRVASGDAVAVVCRSGSVEHARSLYADEPRIRVVDAASSGLADEFAAADVLVNAASGRPPHGTDGIMDAHAYQLRLLDFADACELPLVVNVSSQSLYATGTAAPKDEHSPLDVSSPYAFSKFAIEQALTSLSRRRPSMSIVSLRLSRLFGAAPGLRAGEFPHRAVATALAGGELEVWRADDVMDLLDVRDAVAAFDFVIEQAGPWRHEVFNVGSGHPVTVADYVARVADAAHAGLGRELTVVTRSSDAQTLSGLDCRKLAAAGWSAPIPLDQSINDLLGYLANEH